MEARILETKSLESKSIRESQLEEVEGKEVLAWVAEQNKTIHSKFVSSPEFKKIEQAALTIYEDKRKIPYISIRNGYLYNFWRDSIHVQGIWRRTTLEEYKKSEPNWEVLLDIDNLPEQDKWKELLNLANHENIQNEHWVYEGCIPCHNSQRVLIELSMGGTDATVIREFDLASKTFVSDGFSLKEAKLRIAWRDHNSLLVGTDTGEGSLTTSGLPKDR